MAQSSQVSPVPTPRDWSRLDPIGYPDPDIIALTPAFNRYIIRNTSIRRSTSVPSGPRAWRGTASAAI